MKIHKVIRSNLKIVHKNLKIIKMIKYNKINQIKLIQVRKSFNHSESLKRN